MSEENNEVKEEESGDFESSVTSSATCGNIMIFLGCFGLIVVLFGQLEGYEFPVTSLVSVAFGSTGLLIAIFTSLATAVVKEIKKELNK